ncbi:MAG: prephenate dehydrogenase/arogenate dehydrogenase family protein [Spirochaetia bacterium]|nr:prephenate dehydrogenase/arogenate dehydrogenase family protein [Spirochaetia bacterium]
MKIGVVGLGLIGGSIFKKLRTLGKYEVVGISREDDYTALRGCDIVFVCTPMSVTLEILDRLESFVDKETIVTDVCSLKGFVSKKSYKYHFIPSHPMAGTENSGWESSFPELFEGANWVITPLNDSINDEQKELETLIEELGANIVITTPEEHDKAAALISHMPLVIAQALCENIKDNQLAQTLASSGFRDTTRLALSNTQMAGDMVKLNRENIEIALDALAGSLKSLLEDDYPDKAEKIKALRKKLFK